MLEFWNSIDTWVEVAKLAVAAFCFIALLAFLVFCDRDDR